MIEAIWRTFWAQADVHRAANGHLMVSWPDMSGDRFAMTCVWLRLRYGLRRAGEILDSGDDILLPDLVGPGFRLLAGWDCWSGYFLLSKDQAGDTFLGRFMGRDA